MANVGFFNTDFDPKTQLDAFNAAGCEHIYYDRDELMGNVHEGDVIVLHEMYCAGGTLAEALEFLAGLQETGVDFVCEGSELDSRTSEDVYRTLGAILKLAKNEGGRAKRPGRRVSRARVDADATNADGMGVAETVGRRGRAGVSSEVVDRAIELYQAGTSVKDICEQVGMSQGTLYKYLRERGISRK